MYRWAYAHLLCEDDNDGDKRLVNITPKTIEFRNYSLRHRSSLEYAIRNINLNIESDEKISIIGRATTDEHSHRRFLIVLYV
jgi:ABC-type bacteriocin/lantibiotic exporter with double-glycine peptidase domain